MDAPRALVFRPLVKGTKLWERDWSNKWYKPLSKRGTHARIKYVWNTPVQTNKTSPIKHENKRNNLSFWSNVWWPSNFIKHDQTGLNTIKHHQTGVQTVKCVVTKQCLIVFGRQTFLVWPRPKFIFAQEIEIAKNIINSLLISKLDYVSSLLATLSNIVNESTT